MTRYVALLRGVNVGGVNIKMAELAECIRELGYGEVRTALASGNVLFETDESATMAKSHLEAALRERFGYEAWVHVLTVDALRALADAYPFERSRDGWHDYVVIVAHEDTLAALTATAKTLDPKLESAKAGKGVLYWTVQKGSTLDSVMGRAQSGAKLKPWLTARNLNTIHKLLA